MLREGHPAGQCRLQLVRSDKLLVSKDTQALVQADANTDRGTDEVSRHTVAIAANLDVAIPADLTMLEIGGVVALRRQRRQSWQLTLKAESDDFMHSAMHAQIGFLTQPLLGQLVEVCPALKGAIAHEEVVFDVADHALIFAFGASPVGAAGTRGKAVVLCEIEKALIEVETVVMMEQDGSFLVVDEDFFGPAAEVLEAADETLVGMLGIQ